MQRVTQSYAIHLSFGDVLTPPGFLMILALQWMAACLLGALIYWAMMVFVFQRRNRLRATNRGALYAALLLATVAGSTLLFESRAVALREPLFWAPVPMLFLLFFYLFCEERYAPRWTRLLMIISTFSFMAAFFPQRPSPTPLPLLSQVPGLLGTLQALSDMFSVILAIVGIAPQVYYRYRHFVLTGERRRLRLRARRLSLGALAIGCFLALIASAALSQPAQAPSPVILAAETGFYLLAALIPIAASFTVLHRRLYDREAFINRLLVSGLLTFCLLLIYVGCITALWFLFPGFPGLAPYEYLPFFILIALLMALAFRPLQARIQERIDQGFYPRRYAAAHHLATFTAILQDETQLDELSNQAIAVIEKSLLSSSVILWLNASFGWPISRGSGGGPLASSKESARQERSTAELRLHRQAETGTSQSAPATLVVAPDDPALASLLRPLSVLEINRQSASSAVMSALRVAEVVLVLPLVSRGELVGLLALGPRQPPLPARRYTYDDCELLTLMAERAAPVIRQAHLAYMQEVEERQRERVEQELRTARRIQEALLPKTVPVLAGWQIATYYQPAREVGGDFYDFLSLTGGRLGIVLGDVTDKGIPAALVMATTRSILRAVAAQNAISPGQVLAQVNELLAADLPASMFVTCFYAILDPTTGRLWYANAGQDLPYLRHTDGVVDELRARGMPLGLMPDMQYEELETTLLPGDSLLFYSDGLVEAHNPQREMFGFPRLITLLGKGAEGSSPIPVLLQELATFTGPDWEQEDDLTLVTLQRTAGTDV
jgi:serine phosphatase RsbU (regulator of sigma subunit)